MKSQMRLSVRSINQSNRSISVRLLFLFCSRAFISRSDENRSKSHFHKKGSALSLVLKVRVFGTRNRPINYISSMFLNKTIPGAQEYRCYDRHPYMKLHTHSRLLDLPDYKPGCRRLLAVVESCCKECARHSPCRVGFPLSLKAF